MKDIYSLTKKLSIQQVGRLRILGNPMPTNEPEEARAHLIYKAILDGEVTDDTSCAALLGLEKSSRYFVRFKREFYYKSLDMFIFLDAKTKEIDAGLSIGMIAFNKCITVMHLWEKGEKELAMKKAIQLLKKYKKFHSTMLNLRLTEILKNYFLYIEPNKKEFRKYKLLYRKCRDINHAQKYAFYCMRVVNNMNSKGSVFGEKERRFCNKLLGSLEMLFINLPNNLRYQKELIRVKLFIYEITRSSIEIIAFSKQILNKINPNNEANYILLLNELYEGMFLHSTEIGDYESAKIYLEKYKKNYEYKKEELRSVYHEIYLLLRLKKYKKAYNKYNEIYMDSKPPRAYYFEHIEIFKIWFHILFIAGKYQLVDDFSNVSKVSIYTFKNNINLKINDKRGINAQLLIIECCYYIVHKQFEKLFDRHEAIIKYYRRHFNVGNSRTKIMLNMFYQISKNIFKKEKLEMITSDAKVKLGNFKNKNIGVTIGYEKILYEDVLNEIVVPCLYSHLNN